MGAVVLVRLKDGFAANREFETGQNNCVGGV
jgi:hypothetical protein